MTAERRMSVAGSAPAAVIFDMDGVLLDSEPLWQRAEIALFGELGIELDAERCRLTIGLRVDEVVAFWFAREPWPGRSPAVVATELLDRVCALVATEAEPLPGLGELLDHLDGRIPVGLATSSPTRLIDAVMTRLGIADRFSVRQSAELETHGKPHPAVYLSAAAAMGVPPTRCVAIEDSVNGVISAKAARMGCIAIPSPELDGDPRFVLADAVVRDLSEIIGLV